MRLFNAQRKYALLASKFRQYLTYAIGEIVLITIGILLALQLNNWNKDIKEREQEAVLLKKLHSEFVTNHANLQSTIGQVETVLNKMNHFLTLMGPEPATVEDNLIHDYMATYYWLPRYSPVRVVFDVSLNSGEINLITNSTLQENLRQWVAHLESNDALVASIANHQNNLSNEWLGIHSWKSSIALTGEMEGVGPSNFPFDQQKFLSLPTLEHAVAMKLILVKLQTRINSTIYTLQQEIITQLEKETSTPNE